MTVIARVNIWPVIALITAWLLMSDNTQHVIWQTRMYWCSHSVTTNTTFRPLIKLIQNTRIINLPNVIIACTIARYFRTYFGLAGRPSNNLHPFLPPIKLFKYRYIRCHNSINSFWCITQYTSKICYEILYYLLNRVRNLLLNGIMDKLHSHIVKIVNIERNVYIQSIQKLREHESAWKTKIQNKSSDHFRTTSNVPRNCP